MEIIRQIQLCKLLSVSKPTLYRMEKRGDLPKRFQLSDRAIGWLKSDIENWMGGKKIIQESSSCSVNFNQSFFETED